MERHTPTDLHVCHEELAFAVVEEANKPRPFFIRPESTIAGVPRLSPAGVELGGWATLLLLSPRASGGLARAWRIAPEDDVKFAIPLPHTGGTRLRAVAPFAGILPERGGFPSVVSHSRIATYLQSHGTLLTQNGISEAQLHALVKLFIALGNHGVFQDDWVGGYTRASLELTAGLAWSLVLLSAPMSRESLPGWLFPPELRVSGNIDERGLAPEPSGLWGLSESDRIATLRRARGWRTRGSIKRGMSVPAAWNGSLFLARLGGIPSGEPTADWREVGRRLCIALRMLDFGALDRVEEFAHLIPEWRQLVAKHRHTSVPHLLHTLKYRDLIRDGRWDRSILVPRLRELQAPNEPLPDIPLARLGPGRLLAALRMRTEPPKEVELLELIEQTLFPADVRGRKPRQAREAEEVSIAERWAKVIGAMPNPRYERRTHRKPNGGFRFLDVPQTKLGDVLRILDKALRPVFPPNTWACAFLPYRGPAWHAHVHSGARMAAVVDIEDFFGSVRPWHVEYWFGLSNKNNSDGINILPDWSEAGRRALVNLAFATDGRGHHWLPQGAPTSPYLANLAATRVDILIHVGARRQFGEGIRYSRYADDLVLSVNEDRSDVEPDQFVHFLRKVLDGAGWTVNEAKVRRYRFAEGTPLIACGVEVPRTPEGACRLTGPMRRRVRAALHHARHLNYASHNLDENLAADRGMLSFAYAATGDPAWLAYTSRRLEKFAVGAAGAVFAEALLAGVADTVDKRSQL